MKIKEIKNKSAYLKKNYPFWPVPKITDKKHCIHCSKNFTVGDFKVIEHNDIEYIVCPNAPKCDGSVIDWFDIE